MKFLNREAELALLADHLSRRGAGMFVLYGRRRIGKTALLDKALSGKLRAAYHVATQSTETEELRRLSATLAAEWDVPFLAAQPLESVEALVAFLESVREPSILAIDELPYLVQTAPSLPGLIQASWDRGLSRGPLKLLFSGSSIGMMEEIFLSRKAPLFGRRSGQLRLGPLLPHHLKGAFPGGLADRIDLVALFGGVPGYLERLDPNDDLAGNLRRRVLARGEPLYEEVPFLLREELREPRVYQAVLAAIAGGARKFGEISSKVGLDRSNLTRYLTVLADLGLIEREVSVTERRPEKSRKGLYRVADPFVATYFAFVHPNRDSLERGRADRILASRILPRLPGYLSRAVEPVLRDLCVAGGLPDLLPFEPAHGGRYWSSAAEIDVVILDEKRTRAVACEVKWTSRPVDPPRLLEDLRRKVASEAAFDGVEMTYALISRSGFTRRWRRAPDERLIDLSSS